MNPPDTRITNSRSACMTECAELCRIALNKHVTPVSRILSIAIKMLKREMPGIRLLVSYADLNQGHEGKIYQASNWVFVGMTGYEASIMLKGKIDPPQEYQLEIRDERYRLAAAPCGPACQSV